ncbi:MAG: helix-turn-helix domain-containing protein [Kiritimatiellia bacterium]
MSNRTNKLAERLKNLRRAKGLTQRDMAKHFQLTDVGYGGWERGDTEPSIDNIMRLCQFFGCSSDSLIGLALPKAAIDANEIKSRCNEAKGALAALFASIDRMR